MDTCKNCGKPLENPDQELCPACRAVENAKARTRREEKAGHARRRRMNRTTRKMLIAVCVLAVVFTGLCVTATVMYDKYNPDEFIASVDAALEALELSEYREQHPAALSGGQKQRVTIGAAIVKDSPVIYFDEPTSGLDYDSMVRVSRLIEQLSASGVIVFVVSHDFEFIVRTCTEVVQLDEQGAVQNHRLTPQILKALSEQYFH